MEIVFGNNKIRKLCARPRGKLLKRLDGLRLADNMQVMKALPGRLHALVADRKGQWALDLEHPMRLILEPLGDPLPISEDGWLDLEKVTAVKLIEVEDYHD